MIWNTSTNLSFSNSPSLRPQSPNNKWIASGSYDGFIKLFDVETGKLSQTLEGHAMPIRSLAFSPDSQYLITGSDDYHIKVYQVSNLDPISTLSGHGSWVLCVTFSPNNLHFASW